MEINLPSSPSALGMRGGVTLSRPFGQINYGEGLLAGRERWARLTQPQVFGEKRSGVSWDQEVHTDRVSLGAGSPSLVQAKQKYRSGPRDKEFHSLLGSSSQDHSGHLHWTWTRGWEDGWELGSITCVVL